MNLDGRQRTGKPASPCRTPASRGSARAPENGGPAWKQPRDDEPSFQIRLATMMVNIRGVRLEPSKKRSIVGGGTEGLIDRAVQCVVLLQRSPCSWLGCTLHQI